MSDLQYVNSHGFRMYLQRVIQGYQRCADLLSARQHVSIVCVSTELLNESQNLWTLPPILDPARAAFIIGPVIITAAARDRDDITSVCIALGRKLSADRGQHRPDRRNHALEVLSGGRQAHRILCRVSGASGKVSPSRPGLVSPIARDTHRPSRPTPRTSQEIP